MLAARTEMVFSLFVETALYGMNSYRHNGSPSSIAACRRHRSK